MHKLDLSESKNQLTKGKNNKLNRTTTDLTKIYTAKHIPDKGSKGYFKIPTTPAIKSSSTKLSKELNRHINTHVK